MCHQAKKCLFYCRQYLALLELKKNYKFDLKFYTVIIGLTYQNQHSHILHNFQTCLQEEHLGEGVQHFRCHPHLDLGHLTRCNLELVLHLQEKQHCTVW